MHVCVCVCVCACVCFVLATSLWFQLLLGMKASPPANLKLLVNELWYKLFKILVDWCYVYSNNSAAAQVMNCYGDCKLFQLIILDSLTHQAQPAESLLCTVHNGHCRPLHALFFSTTQRPCPAACGVNGGGNPVCEVSVSWVNSERVGIH